MLLCKIRELSPWHDALLLFTISWALVVLAVNRQAQMVPRLSEPPHILHCKDFCYSCYVSSSSYSFLTVCWEEKWKAREQSVPFLSRIAEVFRQDSSIHFYFLSLLEEPSHGLINEGKFLPSSLGEVSHYQDSWDAWDRLDAPKALNCETQVVHPPSVPYSSDHHS